MRIRYISASCSGNRKDARHRITGKGPNANVDELIDKEQDEKEREKLKIRKKKWHSKATA